MGIGTVREYLDGSGRSPFGRWFARLGSPAAARVTAALYRLEQGNTSNVKSVGKGVSEYRIDLGPGYRIYFGRHQQNIIILLGGGTKKGQQKDIQLAQVRWQAYKRQIRSER